MDAGVATFTGTCVDVDRDFKAGDSVVLSITASLRRSAFTNPNAAPQAVSNSADGRKTFHDDLKETETEKGMRERKAALNTLFSRVNLTPVVDVETKGDGVAGQLAGKREMLDQYEKSRKAGEEEEEKELSEDALAQVCKLSLPPSGVHPISADLAPCSLVDSKAIKNDANLPEAEPSDNFALSLRPCESHRELRKGKAGPTDQLASPLQIRSRRWGG
jgi:hypothetical protein